MREGVRDRRRERQRVEGQLYVKQRDCVNLTKAVYMYRLHDDKRRGWGPTAGDSREESQHIVKYPSKINAYHSYHTHETTDSSSHTSSGQLCGGIRSLLPE